MRKVQFRVLIPALLALLSVPSATTVGAQSESACTSFLKLEPDAGAELAYSFPLRYGSFADVEVAAPEGRTVQIEVTVFERNAIKDRRTWILIPGRVELLTDILDVENLFEIGSPLLVRMAASSPVSAILVRE